MTAQRSVRDEHDPAPEADPRLAHPWRALWAIMIGFFMILIDTTIVTVAIPRMQTDLDTSLSNLIWVTSAYLLAYAVPLLITGRLGDRLGQKSMYIAGLLVFTASSLWCGLAGASRCSSWRASSRGSAPG